MRWLSRRNDPQLGTIWGPQVSGEQVSSVRHGLPVGVQITLGCCQSAVAGDLSEIVHRHAGVGHPGQPRMPQAVAFQVLVAKLSYDFVPRGGVAQRGGGDTSAFRAGEQSSIGSMTCKFNASPNEVADGIDQRNLP